MDSMTRGSPQSSGITMQGYQVRNQSGKESYRGTFITFLSNFTLRDMRISPGPKIPRDDSNILLSYPPKTPPTPAFLHLVLGGRRVLGGQAAQGLPSLQEVPSHPVEEAKVG